ncbi:hypothetical protein AVEN_148146-1 [Araneus ventricosus]|uniref:Uncharacterized protein n=1 Tax=Araneus ventricosus TaxID=182803 RepID=A0A4Y2K8H1_ARAVE|nr:hypothetical protein AVEN_148146-1 [Araneus ventricosus]
MVCTVGHPFIKTYTNLTSLTYGLRDACECPLCPPHSPSARLQRGPPTTTPPRCCVELCHPPPAPHHALGHCHHPPAHPLQVSGTLYGLMVIGAHLVSEFIFRFSNSGGFIVVAA